VFVHISRPAAVGQAGYGFRITSGSGRRSLRNGEIEGIDVPSRPKVEVCSLLRTQNAIVTKQTHCKNQIKFILCFYGILIPDDFANGYWSKRFINGIESIRIERASGLPKPTARGCVHSLLKNQSLLCWKTQYFF
jgi:hypothetical protein